MIAGYSWSQEFTLSPAAVYFPVGCALRAEVRDRIGGSLLATLTTAAGTLERVTDDTMRATIPAAVSRGWSVASIVFDIARTDVMPDTHYGFRVTVPVSQPVTASSDAAL